MSTPGDARGHTGGEVTLCSERLRLRRWRESDDEPMRAINRDPEVRRYLNRPLDEQGVAGFHGAVMGHWQQFGYGPWAIEWTAGSSPARFAGFVGLFHLPAYLPVVERWPELQGVPELGWRLARASWGAGLATEAALMVRDHAIDILGLPWLIAVIHPENVRSHRVAEKLGMAYAGEIPNPALGIDTGVWTMAAGDRPR